MTRTPRAWRLEPTSHVHLVGIGGAGMSALARILLERGLRVSGSDLRGGRAISPLSAMGAQVAIGHRAEQVAGADLVVVSTAVAPDNPEVVRATQMGVPVVHRAALLDALMDGTRRILVAGTHGKTTTTSMVTVALQAAGLDPSFAIGGMIHEAGTSAHNGSSDVFVAEADESDRSFLLYEPDCAIVTNVELDHHDVYTGFDDVADAFVAFLQRRSAGGVAVICADDPGARRVRERSDGPVVTYGQHPDADVRVTGLDHDQAGQRFTVSRGGQELGEVRLRVPGRHNALNATAAAAACLWAGVAFDDIVAGLGEFGGAQRRFQRMGTVSGVTVVDDYAHHPTELVATLDAARQTGPSRVIAVFQPHRYSRTAALGADLGRALAQADVAIVTDVYAAGEAPVPGVTGELVADAARTAGVPTTFVASAASLPAAIAEVARAGDLVLTLGAGDITEVGPQVLRLLAERPVERAGE